MCIRCAPHRPRRADCTRANGALERTGGFQLLFWEADFRAGGASRLCLRSPEGRDYWAEGVRLEIVEPERIVFTGTLEAAGECLTEGPGTVTFRRTEGSERWQPNTV